MNNYGIDNQVQNSVDTYRDNPEGLAKKYQMNQQLVDLLALQKLKSDKEAAARQMQMQASPTPTTVADQREQEVFGMTRDEIIKNVGGTIQYQTQKAQQQIQNLAGLGGQSAPNVKKMAEGGIVGYSKGETVTDPFEEALRMEGVDDPFEEQFYRAIYASETTSGQNVKDSNRGARGPMQVMPATFGEVADEDMDINNSVDNIRAGIRYAKQGLRKAGGDPRLAAAHYYGGPGGMEKLSAGVAVSDPENPNFPSTAEYADRIVNTMGNTIPQPGTPQRGGIATLPTGFPNTAEGTAYTGQISRGGAEVSPPTEIAAGIPTVRTRPVADWSGTMGSKAADLFATARGAPTDPANIPAPQPYTPNPPRFFADTKQKVAELSRTLAGPETQEKGEPALGPDPFMGPNQPQPIMGPPTLAESNQEKVAGIMALPQRSPYEKRLAEYEKMLAKQQDPEKLRREKLRAFLMGGAGGTNIGANLSGAMRGARREGLQQEEQIRKGQAGLLDLEAQQDMFTKESAAALDQLYTKHGAEMEQIIAKAAADAGLSQKEDERDFVREVMIRMKDDINASSQLMQIEDQTRKGKLSPTEAEQARRILISDYLERNQDVYNLAVGGGSGSPGLTFGAITNT